METPKRILVPTDFSTYAKDTFDYALMLARQFNAEIYVIHVVSDIKQNASDYSLSPTMVEQYKKTSVENSKVKIQEEIVNCPDAKGLKIMADVKTGVPYQEILLAAEKKKVDLIVIATHGRSAFIHQIMGSVAERVMRGAKCPILLMRL